MNKTHLDIKWSYSHHDFIDYRIYAVNSGTEKEKQGVYNNKESATLQNTYTDTMQNLQIKVWRRTSQSEGYSSYTSKCLRKFYYL